MDEIVLDLLETRALKRSGVLETPRGVCRLAPSLGAELAHRHALRPVMAPLAENLGASIVDSPIDIGLRWRAPEKRRATTEAT